MKVEIVLGDEFKRQFKRLAKKYPSLKDDFITFKKELADDPFQGSDLGNGTRKVRMAIASKGKGKSGGARVITFNFIQHDDDSIEITLLTIYDKGEISSVTDKYIMDKVITSPLYTIPLSLTGERDVSFRRYGVWCFISVII